MEATSESFEHSGFLVEQVKQIAWEMTKKRKDLEEANYSLALSLQMTEEMKMSLKVSLDTSNNAEDDLCETCEKISLYIQGVAQVIARCFFRD